MLYYEKSDRFLKTVGTGVDPRLEYYNYSDPPSQATSIRGTQRQFSENICSEDDLRSRIFGTFVVNFFACLPLLGFSNI